MQKASLCLPAPIANFIICDNVSKPTFSVSNVFVPTPLCIGGAKSIKMLFYGVLFEDLTAFFTIVGHRDILWVSFTADVGRCDEGQQIISLYEKTLDSVLT